LKVLTCCECCYTLLYYLTQRKLSLEFGLADAARTYQPTTPKFGLYPGTHPRDPHSLSLYSTTFFTPSQNTPLHCYAHTLHSSPSIPELFSHHFLLSLHHSHTRKTFLSLLHEKNSSLSTNSPN